MDVVDADATVDKSAVVVDNVAADPVDASAVVNGAEAVVATVAKSAVVVDDVAVVAAETVAAVDDGAVVDGVDGCLLYTSDAADE